MVVSALFITTTQSSDAICLPFLAFSIRNKPLENTEGTIKNGKSRETGNIDEEKQSKNTTQYVFDTTLRTEIHSLF
jgi:hypothetical protein